MDIIFGLIQQILSLYKWAFILNAVLMTLASFGVIDTRNRVVWTVMDFLDRVTAPLLRPIRRIIPYVGNIDVSPIIAIMVIWVVQQLIYKLEIHMMYGGGL
jgi:YggT family protein